MTYQMVNGSNPVEVITQIFQQVPSLAPLLMFFVWITLAGSGYMTRRGKISMWLAISGLITSTGGLILMLVQNFSGDYILMTMSVSFTLTLVFVMWFLFERD